MNALERAYDNAGVCHTVEFASGASGKPLRLEAADLSRTQPAHRAIKLGFQIVRTRVGVCAQKRYSVLVQSLFRTVRPKDDRSLAGIRFAVFVLETFDHGIATDAINDCQPAGSRIQPQLRRHVYIVHSKHAIVPHRNRRILRWAKANVIAIEITAEGICRSESPEIVVKVRSRRTIGSI